LKSQLTLLSARLKQFFAEGKSPFFQMQFPKHSQASASDGFNLTWGNELSQFQTMDLKLSIITPKTKWNSQL
jgi:hypothetical protein